MADLLSVEDGRITLHEYGRSRQYALGDVDLDLLDEANARWKKLLGLADDPIRTTVEGGTVTLRAEGVTGVVRVGELDIEISPKFLDQSRDGWQSVLWQILTLVEGGLVDDALTRADEAPTMSVPDLLAEMFLSSFARGAGRGLPRGYMTLKGSGPALRGSLDLARIGEWLSRPWQLPYVADYLTDNTSLARLLRWTAETLAATVRHAGRARALREVTSTMAHVDRRPPHLFDAQRIQLGLQHRGLEPARIVGVLLLEGAGLAHAKGAHALSGFLWNSDEIYENFVFWLCARAASRQHLVVDKRVIRFGEVVAGSGRPLETTPDVVFRDRCGVPVAVLDSKYKLWGSRPKSSDTYQVLTAAHVLGCDRLSLAYPDSKERMPTSWRVESLLGARTVELTALPLNLMALAEPRGVEFLIDTISGWLLGSAPAWEEDDE